MTNILEIENECKPKVSIIIPVYNAEKYLQRCLDSIKAQTLQDFEAILVNDGSSDNSGLICDDFCCTDPRFKVIHQNNSGVSAARQIGLDIANGEYVIHADSDDWVEPDWLHVLYREAVGSSADMVICDFEKVYKDRTVYYNQCPSSLSNRDIILDMLKERIWGSCWNKLVKREIFQTYKVMFQPEMNLWEDLYVNCKLLLYDIKVSYVPRLLYHYDAYSNENSIVRFRKDSHIHSGMIFIDTFEPILTDNQYSECWYSMKTKIKKWILLMGNSKYSIVTTYPEINDRLIREAKNDRPWSLQAFITMGIKGHFKSAVAIYRLINFLYIQKKKLEKLFMFL